MKVRRVQLSRAAGWKPWTSRKLCLGCGVQYTWKPPVTCTEPQHAASHATRSEANNLLRRTARADARAKGEVKRYGTVAARKAEAKRAYKRRRTAILQRLGDRCGKCGFADARALQVHHTDGDGARDRAGLGWRYHYQLFRMPVERLRAKFDLLCANCHAIEHAEGP